MVKLERVEHKVFASEAPLDEMGQFGSALDTTLLNTKNIEEIQSLPAYLNGWGSAVVSENNYPTMEEMNGVLNVMSYQTGYLYQEGIPVWYDRQEYSSSSIVKGSGGQKLYCSLKDNNIGHSLTDPTWWKELEFGGGGMPVGTIFAHSASAKFVPENSLACDGMEYTQTQFPSLYTNWLINGNLATCTYEEYQQEITTTGECLKFGIDTVQGKFKVPTKLNKYVSPKGGGKAPVVGNGMTLGLTNGSSNCALGTQVGGSALLIGGVQGFGTKVSNVDINPAIRGRYGVTTDPTKSGIEADLSNAIKTKEIKYFVVIATGSIKQSEMDWSQWASGLEGKANVDLANTTEKLSDNFISKMLPDYTAGIDLSLYNNSSKQFTTPSAGLVRAIFRANLENGIYVNNTRVVICNANDGYGRQCLTLFVEKGVQVYALNTGGERDVPACTFFPLKGAN